MDTDRSERWRARLEAELEELTTRSRSSTDERAPVTLDQQSVGRLSRIDSMRAQAMAQAGERRRQARIAGLRQALQRLEAGEFGYCEACGDAIAQGRLEVDPTARYCVGCLQPEDR